MQVNSESSSPEKSAGDVGLPPETDAPAPGRSAEETTTPPTAGVPDLAKSSAAALTGVAALEREGEVAADYLEEFLDIVDLDGDLDLDVEGDRAIVAIVGTGLDSLVGERGRTLEALQELTRLAVTTQTGSRSRLMLDIAGWRVSRRTELTRLGTEAAQRAQDSGAAQRLAPMTPFERKIVHDAVAAAGASSESEGEEPSRRVVVQPG